MPSPPATIPEAGPRSSTLFSREGQHCAHAATESERELTLRPGRALENMPWGAALGGLSEGGCDVDWQTPSTSVRPSGEPGLRTGKVSGRPQGRPHV